MTEKKTMHGTARAIGCSHLRLGNFGRLLNIPMTWADDVMIGNQRRAEEIAAALGGQNGVMHDVEDASGDSVIPAAYTFFAQFVDHDITLDAGSELHNPELPPHAIDGLPNLRSASLDLDSVYGFGPDASPHLYDPTQRGRLLVSSQVNGVENPNDVPRRADGHALLGDPRNDENLFLSQLHLLFLRFHNRLLIGRSFEEAQRQARFHYQAIVLYDFLKRICDDAIYNFALERIEGAVRQPVEERDYPFFLNALIDEGSCLRMPVEFAAAAYRFGHSMVRSQYPVNENYPAIEIFDERFGTLGFRQVPPELTVDWRFLLNVKKCHPFANSKAIDHLLADELIRLPDPVVGRNAPQNDRALAFRNLLRGYVLGLPSGQCVAAALADRGYPIDRNQDLRLGDILARAALDDETRGKLANHTPLFLYLMREAGVRGSGNRLGPVGSAILMEVFGAMLVHCETSFLRDDSWDADPCLIDENVDASRDQPDNANGSQPDNEDGDEPDNANEDPPAEGARHPNAEKVTLASLVRYVGGTSQSRCTG